MLKRIVDFEVAPPPAKETRGLVALGASAVLHAIIILLLIFGIPASSAASLTQPPDSTAPQPIALQAPRKTSPLPKLAPQPRQTAPQPPPPPPPPIKEVELGPDSKKPDAPAKEAAAKQSDADAAAAATTPDKLPTPAAEPPKPDPQPAAPQRLQVPRPGDYTGVGIPRPSTSPWGPPKLDSASGEPPSAPETVATGAMGRSGLSSHDPNKWENSFDDETAGRCVDIPELGKNPDGSPVLATVLGRVLAPDGHSPMSGAHLQIMGTPFGTFSDNNGEYRLPFDPHMLAKCRKQYVQVVAPGYRTEMLTLMIGPRVRSDDVVLRRH